MLEEIQGFIDKFLEATLSAEDDALDPRTRGRCAKGFSLLMQHCGEYPNDRLCLKELEMAARRAEITGTKIDFSSLSKLLEKEEGELPLPIAQQWALSPETLSTFYTIGSKLYEEGNFEDAICVFSFLSLLNGYSHEVWVCLGMSHQRAGEWLKAIQSYTMANLTDPYNPIPFFYSVDCHLARNDRESAKSSYLLGEHFTTESGKREQMGSLASYYQTLVGQ